MKTADLEKALAGRYCAPAWAFFTELQPETGLVGRRMDACALRLWPSGVGHQFLGFELKVSVSDFKNDLKDPDKFIQTYEACDAAFYVTPKGLLDKFEVPQWCNGVLELDSNGNWEELDRKCYKKQGDMRRGTVAALCRKTDPQNLEYRLSWAQELHKRNVNELKRSFENKQWEINSAYKKLQSCI